MALIDLVNDPYSAKRYLAEIGGYDIAGTTTTTVRVINHGLIRAKSCGLGRWAKILGPRKAVQRKVEGG